MEYTEEEEIGINELTQILGLPREKVLQQALRHYQMHILGVPQLNMLPQLNMIDYSVNERGVYPHIEDVGKVELFKCTKLNSWKE